MYLIPKPQTITYGEGNFRLTYESYLVLDPGCGERLTRQALLTIRTLEKELGFAPMLTRGEARPGDVLLKRTQAEEEEGYSLKIDRDNVTITGGGAGIWHGIQTLLQIVEQCGPLLPALTIEDRPDIPNRGFYHDITRGRIPKVSFLKELVDKMAYYKLNQLQLYVEHTYLFRDLSELWRDDTPLCAQDILELDAYCAERGVELVPSLSSFGHLYKLLSSPSYAHLCELPDADSLPVSLMGRMSHHTIDVTNPDGIALVKKMIAEFMPLFSSRQFNICADETFDLGKGRSKAAADEKGVDRIYIDYVKELCEFVVEKGRRPMFWGDIICGFPELVKELPPETVCLNWGYDPKQREDESRWLSDAGAVQYSCPGAGGWNHLLYPIFSSYENIRRMCGYAGKYGSIGVLNTDWGDFLHVNQPELGIVGMIYGAAFSWNKEIPEFEEVNRQISRIEFRDDTESVVGILAEAEEGCCFDWARAVRFMELHTISEFREENREYVEEGRTAMERAQEADEKLLQMTRKLYTILPRLHGDKKVMKSCLVGADGICLLNQVGRVVYAQEYGMKFPALPDRRLLAESLEKWLYHYKEIYRRVSRESELTRLQAMILWYADYLRCGTEAKRL